MFNRFLVVLEIQFQSRCMADPTVSDIDFKNKMALVLKQFTATGSTDGPLPLDLVLI